MKLWGRASAFNVQKVLWCLGELGLDFDHEEIGGAHGPLDTAEFLALNPMGKVPVLADGEVVVWESHAILRYLAARYGNPRFWPESPAARSVVDRWMDWSQTALQPDFMKLFWGFYRMPENQRDQPAIRKAAKACEGRYRQLALQLSDQRYLAGEAFSLADIPAGTTLYRYFEMGLQVEWLPEIEAWYGRLREREGFARYIMVAFDELKGRENF